MGILVCGILLVALGVFMIVLPKACIKKEAVASEENIRQVRRSGIAEVIFGVILLIIGVLIG